MQKFPGFAVFTFAVALCLAAASTGCRDRRDHRDADTREAQPQAAPASQPADEDAAYRRWEAETRREHVELARRTAAEQREYSDWRRTHR